MGEAEVRAYQEAKAGWDAARARVDRLVSEIEEVAQALRRSPLLLTVSHVAGGSASELRPINSPVLDGRRWPTAEAIAAALNGLRDAAFTVRGAWSSLTDEEKAAVEPAEGALI